MPTVLSEHVDVTISERWAHPEMLKIRELGAKAVPDLRRALREKENPWGDKSGRIFVRVLLLPAMMNLGFPGETCIAVCRTGLMSGES